MNEKQLAKLIKQNVAKAEQAAKQKPSKNYDATLPRRDESDEDMERGQMFDEMKRREF